MSRDAPDPRRVEELFARAFELPAGRRSELLAAEAGAAPAEVEAVRSLLEAHEREAPLGALDPDRAVELLDAVHGSHEKTIGPYRIVREIGRGGMGTVYLAERVEGGFEQRVALKLVHPGLGSEAIVDRFRQERQILASLDHPGIARLLDGGALEDGQPYFAMEYVAGEPITRFVRRQALPLDRRLELFVQVCEAVQRAHGSLVIHRDLKPSNVLVSEDGLVKLVDFGIAKVLEPSGSGENPPTRVGLHSLTPEYASPEQVLGRPVGTSSDIYALGVLLYELLTGHLPYDGPLTSPAEVVQAVCESEPPPPSSASGDLALDGDLDAICLKALAKESGRRYGSADALAEDVRRYRSGLPIGARPPSALYRAGKFVRRHRWGVAAAAAAVAALLVGLAGTAWQGSVAADQRDRAAAEAAKATEIQEFLTSLLQSVDPVETGGAPWTADELLDRGVERSEALIDEQPEVAADVLGVMGRVSHSLGQYERAESLWRRSLELRRRFPGPGDRELIEGLRKLASTLLFQARYDESEALLDEALELARRGAATDLEGGETELGLVLDQIGTLKKETSRFEEAEGYFREALEILLRRRGEEHPSTLAALENLAGTRGELGDLQESIALAEEALQIIRRVMGERHATVAVSLSNLARSYAHIGDYRTAEAYYREALSIGREVFGEDHPMVTTRLSNLAMHLGRIGQYEESAALFQEVLELDRAQLGEDHPYVAYSLDNLGVALAEQGSFEAALERFGQARRILLAQRGPDDPHVAANGMARAIALIYRGDADQAIPVLEEAHAVFVGALRSGHRREIEVLCWLAEAQAAAGSVDEAEQSYRQALGLLDEAKRHLVRIRLETGLGRLLLETGRTEDARPVLAGALSLAQELLPAGHPQRHATELAWAGSVAAEGEQAEASVLAARVMAELAERSDAHTERLRRDARALLGPTTAGGSP